MPNPQKLSFPEFHLRSFLEEKINKRNKDNYLLSTASLASSNFSYSTIA